VIADTTIAGTWLTPDFVAALSTLVTAITGLVIAVRTAGIVSANQTHITSTKRTVEATQGAMLKHFEVVENGLSHTQESSTGVSSR